LKIETEAKFRLREPEAMAEQLASLDAQYVETMREVNIFVDSDQRRLNSSDRGLRVRRITTEDGSQATTITYKGPRMHGKLKNRREIELHVDSPEAALALFSELGFHEVIRFEKRRRRFRLDACTIELDELPYLGHFLEIEGPDEPHVLAVRERLRLADEQIISSSYVAMLHTHLLEHGIAERDVRFPAPAPSG